MPEVPNVVSLISAQQAIRNTEFRDIYSNFVRIGVSGADINVVFSKIVEPALGINAIEDQAIVRMSPHQFKTFVVQATQTLAAWEEVFGEVTQSMKVAPQEVVTEGVKRLKDAFDNAKF